MIGCLWFSGLTTHRLWGRIANQRPFSKTTSVPSNSATLTSGEVKYNRSWCFAKMKSSWMEFLSNPKRCLGSFLVRQLTSWNCPVFLYLSFAFLTAPTASAKACSRMRCGQSNAQSGCSFCWSRRTSWREALVPSPLRYSTALLNQYRVRPRYCFHLGRFSALG